MIETIRTQLSVHGKLPVSVELIGNDDNLREAGLSSFAAVQLMLGLEDALDIEFPDDLMSLDSFETIAVIIKTIETIEARRKAA